MASKIDRFGNPVNTWNRWTEEEWNLIGLYAGGGMSKLQLLRIMSTYGRGEKSVENKITQYRKAGLPRTKQYGVLTR